MRWRELSLEVPGELVEPVAEVFHRYGYGGVAVYPGSSLERVTVYLPATEEGRERENKVEEALAHLSAIWPLPSLKVRELEEEAWGEAWKAYFPVLRVGKRAVIKPTWQAYAPQAGDVVVELDPGMAFGSGHHPTTRRCLEELEKLPLSGKKLLDLGTGSGILAIAAAKLGAASVLALDTDPVAVGVARENAQRNGVDRVVQVEEGSLPSPYLQSFFHEGVDFLLANLTAKTLVNLAGKMLAALAPDGLLLASGVIAEQLSGVTRQLQAAGGQVREVLKDDDWRTLLVRVPP